MAADELTVRELCAPGACVRVYAIIRMLPPCNDQPSKDTAQHAAEASL